MHRIERVSREIVRVLSQAILHELNDPRMGFVTVTRAKVSADLRIARVYLSILGGEKEQKLAFAGIRHAKGFLQRTLGNNLRMRYTPELVFIHDTSVEKAIKMSKLLSGLAGEKNDDSGGEESEN